MTQECLKCKGDIEVEYNFDALGDVVECTHCGNKMEIIYDECYNDEEEEYDSYWYLEQIED